MEARPVYDYILTGMVHWYLQHIQPGAPVHGEQGLVTAIRNHQSRLALFRLQVTTNAGWELNGIREELAALPPGAVLAPEVAERLRRCVAGMERTLNSEAQTLSVFVVGDKRFETRKLLYEMSSMLRAGTFAQLPIHASRDLSEAGKCIAFERPTAAAFHLLRATEAVLRHYYSCVVKRNRLSQPWLWKPMTDQLGNRRQPPPKVLLDALDGLRTNFRNPTAHPEKNYDVDEAQDLLASCVDVINRMTKEPEWQEPKDSLNAAIEALMAQEAAAGPDAPQQVE
ncbi:MAG: hypothetical protein U0R50_17685 [Gaiellales bacterium]